MDEDRLVYGLYDRVGVCLYVGSTERPTGRAKEQRRARPNLLFWPLAWCDARYGRVLEKQLYTAWNCPLNVKTKTFTDEHRKNIGKAGQGQTRVYKKRGPNLRISKALTGRKLSDDHRRRIRDTRREAMSHITDHLFMNAMVDMARRSRA